MCKRNKKTILNRVTVYKGEGDVMSCGSKRGVKLLEYVMKIVGRIPERRIRILISLNKMQFGLIPGKRTVNAIFNVKRMQVEYQKRTRSCT